MDKKVADWANNAFSRITNLEGGFRELREQLSIIDQKLENLYSEVEKQRERPITRLEAVQPGPNKAAERRKVLEDRKKAKVLPQ